jgi:hypothetical protein
MAFGFRNTLIQRSSLPVRILVLDPVHYHRRPRGGPHRRTAEHATHLDSSIVNRVTAIPSIAVAVRRLHDIDRSGWWILIGLIPLVGVILLLVWFASEGTHGPNRFGPDPLAENPVPNEQFGAPA